MAASILVIYSLLFNIIDPTCILTSRVFITTMNK